MKNVIVSIVLAILATACSEERRYVFTEADVAAQEEAKKNGQKTWVDTEQNVHALTCLNEVCQFGACSCLQWARNAPAGTFDCSSDTTAYSGEILALDFQSSSIRQCFGINESSSTQVSALGDYNDVVWYFKNNSSNTVNVYEHGSFGGAMLQTIWQGGNTLQAVTTSNNANQKVSSFRRN
jgi:hypothetical protein